eukprot:12413461-Karenia_brevis.AAC.1
MGPCAQKHQWSAALDKFHGRVGQVAHAGVAALLSSMTYNSKCMSVFSYKAQLFNFGSSYRKMEMAAVAR